MLFQLIRIILGCRQCQSRRDNTLNRRVISQVQEQSDSVQTAVGLEVFSEETCCFHVDTHCSKDDREVVFMTVMHVLSRPLYETRLSNNLCCDLEAAKLAGRCLVMQSKLASLCGKPAAENIGIF